MKTKLLLFLCVFILGSITAQEDQKNLYSGGMLFFQPGKLSTENPFQKINDFSSGIGGILRFYPVKNFTAGIYGGSQKTSYNSQNSTNSYITLGYGGVFAGLTKRTEKFRFTASMFIGGGSVKNLHIEKQNLVVLEKAFLYENYTMVFSPVISIDYFISKKILASIQAVFFNAEGYNKSNYTNKGIQLGILFNR